jgi:hypothetical protein
MAKVAWLTEGDGFGDPRGRSLLTGRFSAVIDAGKGLERGPGDASLEDALAWARARARYVLVCSREARYNAGAKPVADHPPLPDPGLFSNERRDPAFAYLDRTADAELIDWCVSVTLSVDPGPLGDAAGVFAEAVSAHAAAGSPASDPDPGSSEVAVELTVSARTQLEATALADAIEQTGRAAALRALPAEPPRAFYGGISSPVPAEPGR